MLPGTTGLAGFATVVELVQTLIHYSVGTAIGESENGNSLYQLSASFDGDTTKTSLEATRHNDGDARDVLYIGKNWGSTKKISGIKVFASSNKGFKTGSDPAVTFRLIGHTSDNPGAGTDLGGGTITDANSAIFTKLTGFTPTAFQYHWIKLTTDSSDDQYEYVAEVQFFEDI